MNSRYARLASVTAAAVTLLPLSAQAGINVHFWDGVYVPHADCPTPEITAGGTDLITPSITWHITAVPEMIGALRTNYSAWAGSPATYTWSDNLDALNGDLYFDWYKAFDVHSGANCYHGAQLTLHYVRAATDPANVDFIQYFTETGDSGTRTNTVDPDPRDDDLPFYFTATDVRTDYTHVSDLSGVLFGDSPYDSHLEVNPAGGSVTFSLQLASWGANDHNITLHNYVTWGYTWQCVPTPGAVTLTMLASILIMPRRRR